MHILLINPNTSTSVTETLQAEAEKHLPSDARLTAVTAEFGFPVISTRVAYAVAAYAALDAFARAAGEFDAVLVGCFGDPGLEALREISPVPVVGLAEASIHAAQQLPGPFGILTIGSAWAPMLTERVAIAEALGDFAGVFTFAGTGLDALTSPNASRLRLEEAAGRAAQAGAQTAILGGATLAGFTAPSARQLRYIDCMQAAADEVMRRVGARAGNIPKQSAPARGLTDSLQRLFGDVP